MAAPHWPQLGCGAVVRRDDSVLLVQRGKPPRAGEWAIPGGKVLPGERLQQAVERELLEETGIRVRAGELVYQLEYIEHDDNGQLAFHYVVLDYAADYLHGEPVAGDDAIRAAWIPFAELGRLPLTESTRDALQQLYPEEFS